ncbi:MAG TPA: hypothetical protein VGL53_01345 [Bryobacteraceae bacterium]
MADLQGMFEIFMLAFLLFAVIAMFAMITVPQSRYAKILVAGLGVAMIATAVCRPYWPTGFRSGPIVSTRIESPNYAVMDSGLRVVVHESGTRYGSGPANQSR